MKRFLILVISCILIFNSTSCGSIEPSVNVNDAGRIYKCDYKSLNINTKITTTLDGSEIIISGNIFKFLTDPLTVKDSDGNVLGYAGDAYGIISQDDHGIYVGDKFEINMCGNFELLGNSYELRDEEGNTVADVKFNMSNTKGSIKDTAGKLIATYSSSYMMNDYTVTIYDNDICSDMSILMIMASYVSDYKADTSK